MEEILLAELHTDDTADSHHSIHVDHTDLRIHPAHQIPEVDLVAAKPQCADLPPAFEKQYLDLQPAAGRCIMILHVPFRLNKTILLLPAGGNDLILRSPGTDSLLNFRLPMICKMNIFLLPASYKFLVFSSPIGCDAVDFLPLDHAKS